MQLLVSIHRQFLNAREIVFDKQTYVVKIQPGVDMAIEYGQKDPPTKTRSTETISHLYYIGSRTAPRTTVGGVERFTEGYDGTVCAHKLSW